MCTVTAGRDTLPAAALMGIQAIEGVEVGDGFDLVVVRRRHCARNAPQSGGVSRQPDHPVSGRAQLWDGVCRIPTECAA